MSLPTDRTVFQNSWVIDDIEESIMKWVDVFNIGPFFLAEYGPNELTDIKYRGEPGVMHMYVALAQAGPVQIELIQPLGDEPVCYRDTVKPGEKKLHHVCVWTDDLDKDLDYYAEKGCETANSGTVKASGARFAYVDTQDELNVMLEIMERNKTVEEVFKMIADAARSWDGKETIIRY